MEAHVVTANNRRWAELLTETLNLIYFVSDIVLTLLDKYDFKAFIEFFVNNLLLNEITCFQVSHYLCHEHRVPIIVLKCHEREWDRTTPLAIIFL